MMPASDYRDAMEVLGLDHNGMAALFGFEARTSRRYARDRDIPKYVERWIRYVLRTKAKPGDVVALLEREGSG